MSAKIIVLPVIRIERSESNGAREALIEIGKNCPFHVEEEVAIHWADDILMNLWSRGFKAVPLNSTEEV